MMQWYKHVYKNSNSYEPKKCVKIADRKIKYCYWLLKVQVIKNDTIKKILKVQRLKAN
jgi:hypothetical protein